MAPSIRTRSGPGPFAAAAQRCRRCRQRRTARCGPHEQEMGGHPTCRWQDRVGGPPGEHQAEPGVQEAFWDNWLALPPTGIPRTDRPAVACRWRADAWHAPVGVGYEGRQPRPLIVLAESLTTRATPTPSSISASRFV